MYCKDITQDELATTNGCGSSYWPVWIFRIPKFISKSLYCCCCCHDLQYQLQKDKEVADLELRACIRNNALNSTKFKKWLKWKVGDLVYVAINTPVSNICYKESK